MKNRLRFIVAVVFFRISLDICYVFYMVPEFENHFLTPMKIDFSTLNYIGSYMALVLAASFSPMGKENMNGLFFLSFMMFVFAPMTIMYGFNQELSFEPILMGLLAMATAFFVVSTSFGSTRIPLAKNGGEMVIIACFVSMFVFVLLTVGTGAIRNLNFDFTKIYVFRTESAEKLDIGLLTYTNLWTQKIFTPFIMAIGLLRKNRLLVVTAIALHVFYFGITQHRMHLFVPLLTYMVYRLYKGKTSITDLYVYATIGVLAALALTLLLDLKQVAAIILRRALYVPASVTFDWVEYFNSYPKVFFTDRLLSRFVSSEYNGVILPALLGDYKRFGYEIGFNTGLIGAGYAQLGAMGVMIYAFILASFVKIANILIRQGLPVFVAAAILLSPLRTTWADSDVFTALLSHGVAIAILVLWLFGRPRQREIVAQ